MAHIGRCQRHRWLRGTALVECACSFSRLAFEQLIAGGRLEVRRIGQTDRATYSPPTRDGPADRRGLSRTRRAPMRRNNALIPTLNLRLRTRPADPPSACLHATHNNRRPFPPEVCIDCSPLCSSEMASVTRAQERLVVESWKLLGEHPSAAACGAVQSGGASVAQLVECMEDVW